MKHLHDHNVAHLDIKLDNIVLTSKLIAKLVDFGFAQRADQRLTMKLGSPGFQPYELYDKEVSCNPIKVDIFSLGVCLFAMLLGTYPFQNSVAIFKD